MKAENSNDNIRKALKSQYLASLNMLRETIEKCPEDLWYSKEYTNAFWQLSYHTLYFAHLYLADHLDNFVPWAQHQENNQYPDAIPGPSDTESKLPLLPEPYTKAQILEYLDFCKKILPEAIDKMDLQSSESGFTWYKIPKLEHQFVNLRHIQHGAAQLADRLRKELDIGIRWVGAAKL